MAGKTFTAEQRARLDRIAEFIGVNLVITPEDLNYYSFQDHGGQVRALSLFGQELPEIIAELNRALNFTAG